MGKALRWLLVLGTLTWVGAAGPVSAQPERSVADLAALVPPTAASVGDAEVPQLHVRWRVADSPSGAPVRPASMIPLNQFSVVSQSTLRGPLVRERDSQWSEHELVVVAADGAGREISWQKLRDPRMLRAEIPDATGELTGEVLYRPETELVVVVPDPSTASLHVYETRWTGEQFVLRPLGRVAVALR